MALMDEDEVSYRDEEEDEFTALASEVFPDVDPEQYGNLKRMIKICVEADKEDGHDKGKDALLMIGLGGPKSKK